MIPLFRTFRTCRSLLVGLAVGLFISGCTSAIHRLHPEFPSYRQTMGKMVVLVPDIHMYEQLPDGSRLLDQAHSREARNAAQAAIARQLRNRRYQVMPLPSDRLPTGEVESVRSLFRSVNRSIQLHTIGPQRFPTKMAAFEYHLGPVADILQACHADGLVLAIGHQTGIAQPTKNWLSIAVVEPEGRIIWYGIQGDHDRFNIRTDAGVDTLVASTMATFWEHGS